MDICPGLRGPGQEPEPIATGPEWPEEMTNVTQYNAKAIQAAIDSDPAISPAEGKAIHALLKGPCGRTDRLIYFVRGRTAYHYNCPACQIALRIA